MGNTVGSAFPCIVDGKYAHSQLGTPQPEPHIASLLHVIDNNDSKE